MRRRLWLCIAFSVLPLAAPSPSVARTVSECGPAVAFQGNRHCTQVSTEGTGSSSAFDQSPSSTRTSTDRMPRR